MYDVRILYIRMGKTMYIIRIFDMGIPTSGMFMYYTLACPRMIYVRLHMHDMGIVSINMGKMMYIIRIFYISILTVGMSMYNIHRHAHVENAWATQCILYVCC